MSLFFFSEEEVEGFNDVFKEDQFPTLQLSMWGVTDILSSQDEKEDPPQNRGTLHIVKNIVDVYEMTLWARLGKLWQHWWNPI